MEDIPMKSQATVRSRLSGEQTADAIAMKKADIARRDEAELAFFGKKQRLKRRFGTLSIIGLTSCLMISWEGILIVMGGGLLNGGPLGLICAFLFCWLGVTTQALVMAELGSMIPVAGGQYNWVAILAPQSYARFLSYLTGWITTIAWQAVTASGVYLGGTLIQGLVALNYPDYIPTQWQTTLLFYAVIAVATFVNTVLARILPQIESGFMVVHLCGFFGILIPLVYLGPKGSAADVFQTFVDGAEWGSNGVAFLVGVNTTMLILTGIDGATHMAEEIENASTVIPRSMIMATCINGLLGFGILVAALFSIVSLDDVVSTPTGYPFMEIFVEALGSAQSATGMIVVIIFVIICATNGFLATASRMLWAFARDRAIPGHRWVSKVHHSSALPLVSIAVSVLINMLLALINIGSVAAFDAFTSLSVSAFYISFMISAVMLTYKKLTGQHLRYGPFKLGRWSHPITFFAIGYSFIGAVFSFFPPAPNPTPAEMNWSIVVFAAVLAFALFYWVVQARHTFTGPIMETSPEEIALATKDRK